MALVAIVGMIGSGKTEVSQMFERSGFTRIRFGDATDIVLREKGLPRNEVNERKIREDLRKQHGMAAFAILALPRIKEAAQKGDVVIDGLYSWEEYKLLIGGFPDLKLVAVQAPPEVRYARLAKRPVRPLTREECVSRDHSEIENLNKGGPIVMADYTIMNTGSKEFLDKRVRELIDRQFGGGKEQARLF